MAKKFLNGRYEIIKVIGAVSMGIVYACRHLELAGHVVAIKVLYPELVGDEAERLGIHERLDHAKRELERVSADKYLRELQGTIGADPIHMKLADARSVRRGSGAKAEGGFESRLAN